MKKYIGITLICVLLTGILLLGGCSAPMQTESADRNLDLSFTTNIKSHFSIPLEQGNYENVVCYGIEDVTINIDGTDVDLAEALSNGSISVDDMIAQARKDASQGICTERAEAKHGLTEFTYYYPDLRVHYVYDIYEAPDGCQHLITDFMLYGIGQEPHFLPSNPETGELFMEYIE